MDASGTLLAVHADLQRFLSDDLVTEPTAEAIEALRGVRVDLSQAEGDVSLVRRVVQGRLDIVGHEVERRRGGAPEQPTGEATPPENAALLFSMPEILSDDVGGSRRPVAVLEPGPIALSLVDELDGIVSPAQLSGIQALAGLELSDLLEGLRSFEVELSGIRRQLHDRIDAIQDEIARRYRDGEASVDALLH